MQRNLLLTLRFDGRNFHGWQVQQNAPSVMAAFQQALWAVLGHQTDIKGCSRTDAGVSAAQYCVSFRTQNRIPCARLVLALNARLPEAIAAVQCREVPQDFHARYSCTGKRYRYRILNSPLRDPFWQGLCYRVARPLDEARLHALAQPLVGRHDFAAFCNSGNSTADTVRTLFDCSVTRQGDFLDISVAGDGFLYNMVRIIAGTLLDLDGGVLTAALPQIIQSGDRAQAGFTAPACGLMLMQVFYPPWED